MKRLNFALAITMSMFILLYSCGKADNESSFEMSTVQEITELKHITGDDVIKIEEHMYVEKVLETLGNDTYKNGGVAFYLVDDIWILPIQYFNALKTVNKSGEDMMEEIQKDRIAPDFVNVEIAKNEDIRPLYFKAAVWSFSISSDKDYIFVNTQEHKGLEMRYDINKNTVDRIVRWNGLKGSDEFEGFSSVSTDDNSYSIVSKCYEGTDFKGFTYLIDYKELQVTFLANCKDVRELKTLNDMWLMSTYEFIDENRLGAFSSVEETSLINSESSFGYKFTIIDVTQDKIVQEYAINIIFINDNGG